MGEILDLRYPEGTDVQIRSLARVQIPPQIKVVIIKNQLLTDVNILCRYHKIETVDLCDLRLSCSLPDLLQFFSLAENFPFLHTLKLRGIQFSKGLGVVSTHGKPIGGRKSGQAYAEESSSGKFTGCAFKAFAGARNALSRLEISGISLPRGASLADFMEIVSENVNRLSLTVLVLEAEETGLCEERLTTSGRPGSDSLKERDSPRRGSEPLLESASLSAITPFPKGRRGLASPSRRPEAMASSALTSEVVRNAHSPAHLAVPATSEHPETQFTFTQPASPGSRPALPTESTPNLTCDFFTRSTRISRKLVYVALTCFPNIKELNGVTITQQDLLEAAQRTQAYVGSLKARLEEALDLYREAYSARLAAQETIARLEREARESDRRLAEAQARVSELETRLVSSEALLRERERKSVESLLEYTSAEREVLAPGALESGLGSAQREEECISAEPGMVDAAVQVAADLVNGPSTRPTTRELGTPRDELVQVENADSSEAEELRVRHTQTLQDLSTAKAELLERQFDLERLASAFRDLEAQNEALRARQAKQAGATTDCEAIQTETVPASVDLPTGSPATLCPSPRSPSRQSSPQSPLRSSQSSDRTKMNMTLSALQAMRESAKELRCNLKAKEDELESLAREREVLAAKHSDLQLKYSSLKRDSRKLAKLVVKVVEVQKQLDAANQEALRREETRVSAMESRGIQVTPLGLPAASSPESSYCSPAILVPETWRARQPDLTASAPLPGQRRSLDPAEVESYINSLYDTEVLEIGKSCRREVDSLEKRWKLSGSQARRPSADSMGSGENMEGLPSLVAVATPLRVPSPGYVPAARLSEPGRRALRAGGGRMAQHGQTPRGTARTWGGRRRGKPDSPGKVSSFLLGLEELPAATAAGNAQGASSLISEIEGLLDAADLVLAASE